MTELLDLSQLGALVVASVVIIAVPGPSVLFVVVLQFINQDAGNVALQMILLGLIPMVVGVICDCTWALTAAKARGWITGSAKRMTNVQRAGGASVIAVGGSVAVSS